MPELASLDAADDVGGGHGRAHLHGAVAGQGVDLGQRPGQRPQTHEREAQQGTVDVAVKGLGGEALERGREANKRMRAFRKPDGK